MFYYSKKDNRYTQKIVHSSITPQYQDLYLPLELDTEFQERHYLFIEAKDQQQKTITIQVRGIEENKGIVFQHPDMGEDLTIPMFISPFIAFDYMSHMKYEWGEVNNSVADCKILHIDIIGFFLVADIYRIFQDHYLDEMIDKLASQKSSQGIIEQKRRLRVYTKEGNKKEKPYIYLNKYVRIASQTWQIAIGLVDTSAIQGNIKYKTLCANTMVNLKYKDNYTSSQKKYMIEQYEDDRERFIAYELDDVKNYEAIQGDDRLLEEVYEEIGISEYYNPSRPPIGATVNSTPRRCR
jgi:effector-binding domain-containing protein